MILQFIDNKESLLSTARIGFQGLFGSSFPSNSKMIQVTNVYNAHLSTKKKKIKFPFCCHSNCMSFLKATLSVFCTFEHSGVNNNVYKTLQKYARKAHQNKKT